MTPSPHEVTRLLVDWRSGNQGARSVDVFVFWKAARLGRRYMSRENPGHTWQTTALVMLKAQAWLYGKLINITSDER